MSRIGSCGTGLATTTAAVNCFISEVTTATDM